MQMKIVCSNGKGKNNTTEYQKYQIKKRRGIDIFKEMLFTCFSKKTHLEVAMEKSQEW